MILTISKEYTYALIGASDNPEKYGNIILRDFMDNGYHIIPINPNDNNGIIEGLQTYKNLGELSEHVDIVIFAVPPQVVVSILPDVVKKGIKKIWMQPGSESKEAVQFCKEHEIEYSTIDCIMVERKKIV